jgi:hypothetical protein
MTLPTNEIDNIELVARIYVLQLAPFVSADRPLRGR